ncbi:MAG: HDOD domain-containing protein [Phycisphaeraceae bacterium]|nr:MAG: HDOD domain-containing protein [Phycisphaeraceae bacterium]
MSINAAAREQKVREALSEISHIATLPEITMRIINLVEDTSSTAQDLQNVISNDPALCARILKVVNSSFYGLPGQVSSINRAIVMLGLNAVKNIAIAASLAKLFRGGDLTPQFSAKMLWSHSNAVAIASKMIANELNLGLGDEAYLAGLIHDIGIMLEMQYDRNQLIDVVSRTGCDSSGVPANDMLEVELGVFGATHEDFGRGLCVQWKFPVSFAAVCGYHHNPAGAPEEHSKLVNLVAVADRVAANLGSHYRLDLISTEVPSEAMDAIGLTSHMLEQLMPKIEEALSVGEISLT